jgi:hypothetical protein
MVFSQSVLLCLLGLGLWYLTPLSTICQLYCGGQFIGEETGENHRPGLYIYIFDGFIGLYLISLEYAKIQTYNFVV